MLDLTRGYSSESNVLCVLTFLIDYLHLPIYLLTIYLFIRFFI